MDFYFSFFDILIYLSLFLIFIGFVIKFLPNKGVPKCNAIELPFIGHFFSMSADRFHTKLTEWCKSSEHGIFQFSLFGETMVVVSNYEGVKEVLITKDDDFAGRPTKELVLMVTRNGKDLAFGDFDERFIYKKKIFMKHIKISNVGNMKLEESTFDVLDSYNELILSKQDNVELSSLFVNLTFDIIVAMITGERIDMNDERLVLLRNSYAKIVRLMGDLDLKIYDTFPWLRKIYHTKKLKTCLEAVKNRDKVLEGLIRECQKKVDEQQSSSFCGALLEDPNKYLTSDEILMLITDTIFAGYGTSSVVLHVFFYQLMKHSDVRRKVMEEITEHIGFSRNATLLDKQNTPYISATLIEVTRWISHVPLLLPHKTVVDTTILDYPVPKETTVFVNAAALHKDEKIWKDPHAFRPERFLKEDGTLLAPEEGVRKYFLGFGAGRRICPGKGFAQHRIFLVVTYILQRYDVTLVDHEENSKIIDNPEDWIFDLVISPGKTFAKFTPKE